MSLTVFKQIVFLPELMTPTFPLRPTRALTILAVFLAPHVLGAQAEALAGLVGNSTDFNFYWTQVAVPHGSLRPEHGSYASGFGFELSFELPGGISRRLKLPAVRDPSVTGNDCRSKVARRELRQDQSCEDTTFKLIRRTRDGRQQTYEEEARIQQFNWREPVVTFELAVGFSQSGALVARDPGIDLRTSIREAPSVSLYGNLPSFHDRVSAYFGARSGLVSLQGGRAYVDDVPIPFSGSTFQVGPVFGVVAEVFGLNFFAEGAYMLRNIESIEWDTELPVPAVHSAKLSGAAFELGVQFNFRGPDKD